jgi:type IV secretory pathway TraG/TraD family ATPase VirD4
MSRKQKLFISFAVLWAVASWCIATAIFSILTKGSFKTQFSVTEQWWLFLLFLFLPILGLFMVRTKIWASGKAVKKSSLTTYNDFSKQKMFNVSSSPNTIEESKKGCHDAYGFVIEGKVLSLSKNNTLKKVKNDRLRKYLYKNWSEKFLLHSGHKKPTGSMVSRLGGDNHQIVLGITRSGKTSAIVLPSIYANLNSRVKPSLIITDPKGELFRETSGYAKKIGYKIIKLNFIDPINEGSNKINPLQESIDCFKKYLYEKYISKDKKNEILFHGRTIDKSSDLFNTLSQANTKSNSKENPFFVTKSRVIAQGLYLKLLENIEKDLVQKGEIFESTIDNLDYKSLNLANILQNLQMISGNSVKEYYGNGENMKDATFGSNLRFADIDDSETSGNIRASATALLEIFDKTEMRQIASDTDFEISSIKKEPTVVYLQLSEQEGINNILANICMNIIYNDLISDTIGSKDKTQLDKPVLFMIDELGNLGKLPFLEAIMTAGAGRKILASLILQSPSQLNEIYGQNVTNIVFSNAHIITYLKVGSTDIHTFDTLMKSSGLSKKNRTNNYLINDSDLLKNKEGRECINFFNIKGLRPIKRVSLTGFYRSMDFQITKINPAKFRNEVIDMKDYITVAFQNKNAIISSDVDKDELFKYESRANEIKQINKYINQIPTKRNDKDKKLSVKDFSLLEKNAMQIKKINEISKQFKRKSSGGKK